MGVIRRILFIISAISVSAQPDWFKGLVEFIQKDGTCEYIHLENNLKSFPMCLHEMILSSNGGKVDLESSKISPILCQLDLTACLIDVGNKLKSCLSDERYKVFFENPAKTLSAMQEYACSDSGEVIQEFYANGIPCIQNPGVYNVAKTCREPFEELESSNLSLSGLCGLIGNWVKCIADGTDICEDKTAKQFIENLHSKWKENNNC